VSHHVVVPNLLKATQTTQTSKEDETLEETTSPGEGGTTTTRRRSTIVGGELSTSTNQEKGTEPDESRTQPSQISGRASGPQPKKENGKPKTWAEAAKGTKITTAMNDTSARLVERNINVQR
jgi:hypothetical protein